MRFGEAASSKRSQGGFTLTEVMVAAMLLLVAMAAFVPFFLNGLSQASSLRYKSLATNVARDHMEKVRRLDYREISVAELEERFGTSAAIYDGARNMDFNVAYDVEESSYDLGTLKKVTVTVDWEDTPVGSAVSLTTMIHQQFLGPRGSLLEIIPLRRDPLGTPFPGISGPTTARYHIAQADWGLVIDNLDQEGMVARNVYMRVAFFDNDRLMFPDEDIKVTDLYCQLDASGKVNDVYFEYQFDSSEVPDGYWEMRTIAYNEYNEPGNVWRLRVRVEDGPPEVPLYLAAVPGADNQSVSLTWTGAPERDRARYVLERRTFDLETGLWPDLWMTLDDDLDPKSTSYFDQGEMYVFDPWGDPETTNTYQYRLHAVDICNPGLIGPPTEAVEVVIPPSTPPDEVPTTTSSTTTSTTSTTLPPSSGDVVNTTNQSYFVTVKNASNSVIFSSSVGKNSTLTVTNLAEGYYQLVATSPGKPTLTQSFFMPEQHNQVVMNIL